MESIITFTFYSKWNLVNGRSVTVDDGPKRCDRFSHTWPCDLSGYSGGGSHTQVPREIHVCGWEVTPEMTRYSVTPERVSCSVTKIVMRWVTYRDRINNDKSITISLFDMGTGNESTLMRVNDTLVPHWWLLPLLFSTGTTKRFEFLHLFCCPVT